MDGKVLGGTETAERLLHADDKGRRDSILLIGNSPSVHDINIHKLHEAAYTFGCNRGLDFFTPNAMIFSDRQPYWQFVGRIRTYKGLLILPKTLFDESVWSSYKIAPPEFDGQYLSIDITTDGRLTTPEFDWNKKILSGPSIVIPMLQIAVMAGYSRVGIIGVDLTYSNNFSHFWGNGAKYGARPCRIDRVVEIMTVVISTAKQRFGTRFYNLSPIRGPVDETGTTRISEQEFISGQ